jgi:hypothetical protein
MISIRDLIYLVGKPFEYIESHSYGLWHKFIESVNMSYIDCNSYLKSRELPIRDNSFHLMTFQDQV